MADNFAACDAFTAREEGGLSMDPNDPGNWTGGAVGSGKLLGTNFGIAAADHPGVDPATLTDAAAAAIRKAGYWMPINGDVLPIGPDLMVYDFAVNAGPARSVDELEQELGTAQDGRVGPNDRNAMAAIDPAALVAKLKDRHEAFYNTMADAAEYGKALDGRAARCAAAAMAMIAAPAPPHPVTAPPSPAQPVPQPAPAPAAPVKPAPSLLSRLAGLF